MKINELIAFLLTSLALVLILVGGVWTVFSYFTKENRCEGFSVDMRAEVEEINLEVGVGRLVKVEVTNFGNEDEFRVGVEGPDWVVVKPEKMKLKNGESDYIFVYLSPSFGVEGKFDVKVFVKSFCVDESSIIRVVV